MPKIVGDGRDTLDMLSVNVVQLFKDAERRLTESLASQVRLGLGRNPDDMVRAVRLGDLRRLAQKTSEELMGLIPAEVDKVMALAQQSGHTAALSELMVPRGVGASTFQADAAGHLLPKSNLRGLGLHGVLGSAPAAVALTAELTSNLRDVTKQILRFPADSYRRAIQQSATDLLLGIGKTTQRSAQVAAWQRLVSEGVKGFTDTTGRKWNLGTYVEMATRTSVRRAWDVQHETTMKTAGIELVSIVVGNGSCKACADQAGKILRMDAGPTGRIKVPSSAGTGDVEVTVSGTMDDARSHGWRHPQCRCRPVAYLPGLSVIEDVTTYDPQAEADRAKLRGMERDLREAKAKAANAVSPEQRNAANARVKALQGNIREHTKATGLARQPNREQLDLGNRPATKPRDLVAEQNQRLAAEMKPKQFDTLGRKVAPLDEHGRPAPSRTPGYKGRLASSLSSESMKKSKAVTERWDQVGTYGWVDDLPKAPPGSLSLNYKEVNPKFSTGKPYQINCTRCATTVELRKRGYNVEANAFDMPDNYDPIYLDGWRDAEGNARGLTFIKGSSRTLKPGPTTGGTATRRISVDMDDLEQKVLAWGEGSRGFARTQWRSGGAHIYNLEVKNGVVEYIDGQGPSRNMKQQTADRAVSAQIMRVDDMHPDSRLSNWVSPKSGDPLQVPLTSRQRLEAMVAKDATESTIRTLRSQLAKMEDELTALATARREAASGPSNLYAWSRLDKAWKDLDSQVKTLRITLRDAQVSLL